MSGINFDEFDPETVGGFDRVAPGSYHAQVVKVDPDGGKGGALVVDFEILAGTDMTQQGKVHQEKFSADLKKIFQKKRAALAFATGIVTIEQAKQAKAEKKDIEPDWDAMVGKQCCMDIVASEDGKYTNLNWDNIWSPGDKKASHVPLHEGMLKRAGIPAPEGRQVLNGIVHPNMVANAKETKAAAGGGKENGKAGGGAAKPAAASPDDLLAGVV